MRVSELKFRFNKTFTLKSSLIDVHDFIEIGKKDGFALQTAIHTGCLEEIQIESSCIEESFRGRYQFVPILRKKFISILFGWGLVSGSFNMIEYCGFFVNLADTLTPSRTWFDRSKHFESNPFYRTTNESKSFLYKDSQDQNWYIGRTQT